MASPHQGSLAPNRSAFNFTQEGLGVQACEPSLAMLNDGMESHLKVLERLHVQRAVPEPPKILTICHTTHLWLAGMHAYAPMQTPVGGQFWRLSRERLGQTRSFLSQAPNHHCPWEKESYRNC